MTTGRVVGTHAREDSSKLIIQSRGRRQLDNRQARHLLRKGRVGMVMIRYSGGSGGQGSRNKGSDKSMRVEISSMIGSTGNSSGVSSSGLSNRPPRSSVSRDSQPEDGLLALEKAKY